MLSSILLVVMSVLAVLYSSWIILFFLPARKSKNNAAYGPISVVIPAYNEAANIESTLQSVLAAEYPAKKEIIVVDDGSKDATSAIVKKIIKKHRNVRLVKGDHGGKGYAVNIGIRHSRFEFIAVLDADTSIEKNSLERLFVPFADEKVGAVSSVLRVKRSSSVLNWFQQFEYAISSSWRYVIDKVDGTCIVPGFCAFRKSAFLRVGGFKNDTAVEDYDICMYLRKSGYKIRMVHNAYAYTKVPETFFGLLRQRMRWSRGTLQVIKKHRDIFLRGPVGFFSVPTQLYWFVHAFFYIPIVIYQIADGYMRYFVSWGGAFSADALLYFVKWFTTYGMVDFIWNVARGAYPATLLNMLTIVVFLLSYSFAVFALLKFSKSITKETIFALLFFFPFSLITLSVNIFSTFYEMIALNTGEKWEKEI